MLEHVNIKAWCVHPLGIAAIAGLQSSLVMFFMSRLMPRGLAVSMNGRVSETVSSVLESKLRLGGIMLQGAMARAGAWMQPMAWIS